MTVEYEIVEDGVLLVTLNRPERLNALNGAAKLALAQVWQRAQDDCAVRAIVLRGAGERAFCAGSDLTAIAATGETVSTQVLANSLPGVGTPLTKPVIAALQGHTLGLGISLAIHCDFRIARHDTRFSFPEVGHGMLSGFSTITLPSLIGEAAARFAAAAQASGVKSIVQAESLDDAVETARQLAQPPQVVLLSPACASYDMFDNYEQRGRVFKQLVRKEGRQG